ncbi:MAG: DNA topoisomerase IV [Bacteroidetes bacterium]|nr:MAG: DNA topoisomerase IV [Bacteroidota bacterium]
MNTFRVIRSVLPLTIILFFSFTSFGQVIPDSVLRKKVNEIQDPLERLLTLEPQIYQYNTSRWKDFRLPGGNLYGFQPENVEKAFPELVSYQNHNYRAGKNLTKTAVIKTVDTESLIPILVASVKQLQNELEKMRMELQLLKKETTMVRSD